MNALFCSIVAVLVVFTRSLSANDNHVFTVTLTNGTQELSSCLHFPEMMQVVIDASGPFPPFLALHRNDVINTDAPVYVMNSGSDGSVYLVEMDSGQSDTMAYQNTEFGAAFIARCTEQRLTIAGTMHVEGRKYRVGPRTVMTSSEEMTKDYRFVLVNDSLHFDDKLQGKPARVRRSAPLTSDPQLRDTERAARSKRQTIKDYYLDVIIALDYAFYQYWLTRTGNNQTAAVEQAKDYIAYIFNEINSRYDTVANSNYRIHMTLSGFIIAQTPSDSSWTETAKESTGSGAFQVNAATVLTNLETWVKANYNTLPKHDHLMLFTDYDLYGDDNGFRFNNTAGFAKIGTMCFTDGSSVSVVEDHGGFQSETTATHELGHSLGATHDGTGNDCLSADRYVMSGSVHPVTSANKLNPWRFSSCSTTYFEEHIATLVDQGFEASCLLERVQATGVRNVTGYPGQLAGPDEQCRQIYGPTSYLCRGTNFGQPEDVCLEMYCRNPATLSSCTLNTAATGTCCGNQKWCIAGQCVSAPSAKCYMSATCPFGQRQGVVYETFTCNELESGNCYNDNFRHVCCEMCDTARTNVYGCEYGDKVRNCEVQYCGRKFNNTGELYDVKCCGTCSHVVTAPTPITTPPASTTLINKVPDIVDTCRDTALINGVEPCQEFLLSKGLAYCCQPNVTAFCCQSCNSLKNHDDPSCPYGDCQLCGNLETLPVPCTAEQRTDCCLTCRNVDIRLGSTTLPPTTTLPTTITTPTTTGGGVVVVDECEEILGVVHCSGRRWGVSWVVLMVVVVLVKLLC